MKTAVLFALVAALIAAPGAARAEFDPKAYAPVTQEELVKNPAPHVGKRVKVSDPFQFCGSDFCVQVLKTKINTRDYYCFTLGPLCLVRMYVKKDHPDAAQMTSLKKGDRVTVYGTFDSMGDKLNYVVADRVAVEKK